MYCSRLVFELIGVISVNNQNQNHCLLIIYIDSAVTELYIIEEICTIEWNEN